MTKGRTASTIRESLYTNVGLMHPPAYVFSSLPPHLFDRVRVVGPVHFDSDLLLVVTAPRFLLLTKHSTASRPFRRTINSDSTCSHSGRVSEVIRTLMGKLFIDLPAREWHSSLVAVIALTYPALSLCLPGGASKTFNCEQRLQILSKKCLGDVGGMYPGAENKRMNSSTAWIRNLVHVGWAGLDWIIRVDNCQYWSVRRVTDVLCRQGYERSSGPRHGRRRKELVGPLEIVGIDSRVSCWR